MKSASIFLGEKRKREANHPFLGGSETGSSAPILGSSAHYCSLATSFFFFFMKACLDGYAIETLKMDSLGMMLHLTNTTVT